MWFILHFIISVFSIRRQLKRQGGVLHPSQCLDNLHSHAAKESGRRAPLRPHAPLAASGAGAAPPPLLQLQPCSQHHGGARLPHRPQR